MLNGFIFHLPVLIFLTLALLRGLNQLGFLVHETLQCRFTHARRHGYDRQEPCICREVQIHTAVTHAYKYMQTQWGFGYHGNGRPKGLLLKPG